MLEFLALVQACAPTVAPETMAAVISVESSYNPYAIGVVGGRLARQPKNHKEAVATAQDLEKNGWNFSLGIAQVNRHNLKNYQITYDQAFDACTNLRVGSKILEKCYVRANRLKPNPQAALHAALSCYYSGNFTRGFKLDEGGKHSYVEKVLASAEDQPKAIPVVPSIQSNKKKPQFDNAAGDVTFKDQQTEPVTLPSDNAPVLLRPKNADSRATKRQPLTTDAPDINPKDSANEVTANRAIVF